METDNLKLANGSPIISSPVLGLAMGWINEEVKNMTEDEFWSWVVKLHEEGLNAQQIASLEARKAINKYLVPANFLSLLSLTLDQIFTNHFVELQKRGYEVSVK